MFKYFTQLLDNNNSRFHSMIKSKKIKRLVLTLQHVYLFLPYCTFNLRSLKLLCRLKNYILTFENN